MRAKLRESARARLAALKRPRTLPHEHRVKSIIDRLSPSEQLFFFILVGAFVVSSLAVLASVNRMLLVDVPARGGSLTEGVIGSPRFVNPLLAISDADRDLAALVYSGLLRAQPGGTFEPDLAENYSVSEDGRTYTVSIRDDAVFHDGEPVTADDVVFTVHKAQDGALKSPKRANWEGVAVEALSEREVAFTLAQPYTPFRENLTLGILPKHVWESATAEQFPFSQFNVEPVGSGPYQVKSIERNDAGVPYAYTLSSFSRYALGEPYISRITMRFYSNENEIIEALRRGEIESANSISPDRLGALFDQDLRIEQTPLPRVFAVFFNQNYAPVFANREVRRALELVVDRERIVDDVLGGFGTPIDSPLPADYLNGVSEDLTRPPEEGVERARTILEENNWVRDEETGIYTLEDDEESAILAFSLTTSNTPELKAAAELVASMWRELGAQVDLRFFDPTDLNQNVIRPREYDAILFGEILGRELDLFAFWHSSQRNDPGLNIALYANITADDLLEEARELTDQKELRDTYEAFAQEIDTDVPAIFLYSPDFIYIVPDELKGLALDPATTPSERFLSVHKWYVRTDTVWDFFQ